MINYNKSEVKIFYKIYTKECKLNVKKFIIRISAILCVLLLIITLSGCSVKCVHCNNKYKKYGSYPYAVLDFNDWSRDALYFQLDRKPINYDFCQNYSSL